MTDILLFVKNGWNNIWKQKTIWLFSVLPLFNQLFLFFQVKQDTKLLGVLLSLWVFFIYTILSLVSFIGVPYIAFNFSVGRSVTVKETLFAVKKLSGRVIGCYCLIIILILPLVFWALASSINNSTHTFQMSEKTIILLLPLSLFSSLWDFSIFGFIENDWGVRKSVKNAWALYVSHFGALATLGISMSLVFRVFYYASGVLTVLFQSGFDTGVLSKLSFINTSMSLSKNLLFILINGFGQTIFTTLSSSIFVLAYLKYNGTKKPSLIKKM